MKKVYNDQSDTFADWTTKRLKQEAKEYYSLIYGEASCYGTSDLRIYSGICRELDSRGVVLKTKLDLC